MSKPKLKPLCLIVDDESDLLELSVITLEQMDCKTASNLTEAKKWLQDKTFDFCLTDMKLPDGNGIELVAYIVKNYPNTPVAMITAYGSVEMAVQALKKGAFDFITKPIEVRQLRDLADDALKLSKTYQENSLCQAKQENSLCPAELVSDSPAIADNTLKLSKTYQENALCQTELVGNSLAIQDLRNQVIRIARSQAPVCIQGESGSGKEIVARLIHNLGPRAGKPFVPVNCGAIPEDLVERELFGHKKGSFTSAVTNEPGLFQEANGGTLFLDEIAELPLSKQVKLLRAIQEKKIRPIGATLEIPINVRILSATHRNLAKLVSSGKFRQDLFFRINVLEINVPPLRDRKEDISKLVDYILTQFSSTTGNVKPEVSPAFIEKLTKYNFPGNVRELENIIERAITLCENNLLEVSDLQFSQKIKPVSQPKSVVDSTSPPAATMTTKSFSLKGLEKQAIDRALKQTRGNRTKAANLLGISLSALRYRLNRLKQLNEK
jgi:two-component system response regulator PilR (NtrC family)